MKALLTLIITCACLSLSAQTIFPVAAKRGKIGASGGGPSYVYDTIQINVRDSASGIGNVADAGWNNWAMKTNTDENNRYYGPYLYTTGATSTVTTSWQLSASTGRAITGHNNNYSGDANYALTHTTNFPRAAFQVSAFTNGNNNTRLIFAGLNNAHDVRIELLSSRATLTDYSTRFHYGTDTAVVAPRNNISTVAELEWLTPVSNRIEVICTYLSGTFVFINAIRLIIRRPV